MHREIVTKLFTAPGSEGVFRLQVKGETILEFVGSKKTSSSTAPVLSFKSSSVPLTCAWTSEEAEELFFSSIKRVQPSSPTVVPQLLGVFQGYFSFPVVPLVSPKDILELTGISPNWFNESAAGYEFGNLYLCVEKCTEGYHLQFMTIIDGFLFDAWFSDADNDHLYSRQFVNGFVITVSKIFGLRAPA